MDLVVFLLWTYAILSWYVMATFAFAPIKHERTSEVTVAFNTPRLDQTLFQRRRDLTISLPAAPGIFLLMAVLYMLMSISDAVADAKAEHVIRLDRH